MKEYQKIGIPQFQLIVHFHIKEIRKLRNTTIWYWFYKSWDRKYFINISFTFSNENLKF